MRFNTKYTYFLSLSSMFLIVGIIPTFFYDLSIFGEKAIIGLYAIPLIIFLGTPYALSLKKKPGIIKRNPEKIYELFITSYILKLLILILISIFLNLCGLELSVLLTFIILSSNLILYQDIEGVTDYLLLTRNYIKPSQQIWLRSFIYLLSYFMLYKDIFNPSILFFIAIESFCVLIGLIFYTLDGILNYRLFQNRATNYILFILKNYLHVGIKKRLVTTLTERMDIFISSLLLSTESVGIVARANTFTSALRPLIKIFTFPAQSYLFENLLVYPKKLMCKKQINLIYQKSKELYSLDYFFSFLFLFSVAVSLITFKLISLEILGDEYQLMAIMLGVLVLKNVLRGYATIPGIIKIRISPNNFILKRSQIDFTMVLIFTIISYFSQNFKFYILSYLVCSTIFFVCSLPKLIDAPSIMKKKEYCSLLMAIISLIYILDISK